jgi:hypothetical protein
MGPSDVPGSRISLTAPYSTAKRIEEDHGQPDFGIFVMNKMHTESFRK